LECPPPLFLLSTLTTAKRHQFFDTYYPLSCRMDTRPELFALEVSLTVSKLNHLAGCSGGGSLAAQRAWR